jgi:hypothetical protein
MRVFFENDPIGLTMPVLCWFRRNEPNGRHVPIALTMTHVAFAMENYERLSAGPSMKTAALIMQRWSQSKRSRLRAEGLRRASQ